MRIKSTPETDLYDKVFDNQLKEIILKSDKNYNGLVLREVIKEVFFNMLSIRESY